MSAILGYFNMNGEREEPLTLSKMKKAIEHLPFEGYSEWENEQIGFGHFLSYNTPEAVYEKQPLVDYSDRYILVARARIDNRNDLNNFFGFSANELATIPDSRFILEAYITWGNNCVDYILGDWAFAIWDKQKKELFVARDHHGNTGLFYYHSARRFYFASSVKSLLALPEIPITINELFVAKVLSSIPRDGEETAYKNIFRLPPAHFLTVSEEKLEIKRYWYLEDTQPLVLRSAEDYYEQFLEIYKEAVRARLRSYLPVAATLSGGLDSGSVCALAATQLAKSGKRLKCYSSVPKYDIRNVNLGKNRFGDESPYIKATAEYYDNIDLALLKSENTSILDSIYRQLEIHSEPIHAAGNYYWIMDIHEKVYKDKQSTLLTGQFGNAIISWTGMPKSSTIEHFMDAFQNNRMSFRDLVLNSLKKACPQQLRHAYHMYHNHNRWYENIALKRNYLTQDFCSDIRKQLKERAFGTDYSSALEKRFKMVKSGYNQAGSLIQDIGLEFGVEKRDPTQDKRVMEYCISVPDNFYRDDNFDRLLIRRSMQNYLPNKVLWNKKRGRQAADLVWRVRDNNSEIEKLLQQFESSPIISNILDIAEMKNVLEKCSNARSPNAMLFAQTFSVLIKGLSAGIFLYRIENENT